MTPLTEQEFRVKSDEALESARRALLPLADTEGFEVELQNGVLNLVFEEPGDAKFVVSPNAPVRQIWVSAMARSYKLAWAPEAGWRPYLAGCCVLAALLYAFTDEFHQWLVPGRGPSLTDCAIDTFGAAMAMLLVYLHRQFLNTV